MLGRRSFFFPGKYKKPYQPQLKNLCYVGAFPGFYCPPAQWAPASATARRQSLAAGSEICGKCPIGYRQDRPSSFKSDLRCVFSPCREEKSPQPIIMNLKKRYENVKKKIERNFRVTCHIL